MQITEIDATDETAPYVAKTYRWNPSEPVATRPLALSLWTREGTVRETLYYAHDLRKNVVSLFDAQGMRRASYEYDPFGNITSMDGDMSERNPYRFSSEHHDEDLGLVYYNYRHYNPTDGRWTSRDPIAEQGGWNLYGFARNIPHIIIDMLGLYPYHEGEFINYGPPETPRYIDEHVSPTFIPSKNTFSIEYTLITTSDWKPRKNSIRKRLVSDETSCTCRTEVQYDRVWYVNQFAIHLILNAYDQNKEKRDLANKAVSLVVKKLLISEILALAIDHIWPEEMKVYIKDQQETQSSGWVRYASASTWRTISVQKASTRDCVAAAIAGFNTSSEVYELTYYNISPSMIVEQQGILRDIYKTYDSRESFRQELNKSRLPDYD